MLSLNLNIFNLNNFNGTRNEQEIKFQYNPQSNNYYYSYKKELAIEFKFDNQNRWVVFTKLTAPVENINLISLYPVQLAGKIEVATLKITTPFLYLNKTDIKSLFKI